jgi:hypothetical protein
MDLLEIPAFEGVGFQPEQIAIGSVVEVEFSGCFALQRTWALTYPFPALLDCHKQSLNRDCDRTRSCFGAVGCRSTLHPDV